MKEKTAADVSQRKNRGLILSVIRRNGPISRSELGQVIGLNKATVSNITKDLLESGMICEAGMVSGDGGRKKVGLALNMHGFVAIALRMTKYHIKSCAYSACDEIVNFRQVRYNDIMDIGAILHQLHDEIECQLAYCKEENLKVLGFSLASLGYVIEKNGSCQIMADGFVTLSETDFRRCIREWYPSYRVLMNHDANASAFAELEEYVRDGNEPPSVLLNIVGDIGLGGGIVIDGHILRGHHGSAGEIGHMGIHGADPGEDSYRRNMFEGFCSPSAITSMVHENFHDFEGTKLGRESTLEDIYASYEDGDPLASFALNRSARYLAYGLAGLTFVLDPDVIVLGDRISTSEKYRNTMLKYLDEFLPEALREGVQIRFSGFEHDSALVGAGKLLLDEMMEDGSIVDEIIEYLG